MAVSVLAVGSAGALVGILSAMDSLRGGQLRVHKQVLVDAALQRARLSDKQTMWMNATKVTVATDMPYTYTSIFATPNYKSGAPWRLDIPTTSTPGASDLTDLSVGALFTVLPDGTLQRCSTSACTGALTTMATTGCDPALLASTPGLKNVFCRDVAVTQTAATFTVAGGVPVDKAVTWWVRVIQFKGTATEMKRDAEYGMESFPR